MATQKDRTRQWARLGASTRLSEIDIERAQIIKEFPELRNPKKARSIGLSTGIERRKLTAEARKKLSAGMRKYWARRKAATASKS